MTAELITNNLRHLAPLNGYELKEAGTALGEWRVAEAIHLLSKVNDGMPSINEYESAVMLGAKDSPGRIYIPLPLKKGRKYILSWSDTTDHHPPLMTECDTYTVRVSRNNGTDHHTEDDLQNRFTTGTDWTCRSISFIAKNTSTWFISFRGHVRNDGRHRGALITNVSLLEENILPVARTIKLSSPIVINAGMSNKSIMFQVLDDNKPQNGVKITMRIESKETNVHFINSPNYIAVSDIQGKFIVEHNSISAGMKTGSAELILSDERNEKWEFPVKVQPVKSSDWRLEINSELPINIIAGAEYIITVRLTECNQPSQGELLTCSVRGKGLSLDRQQGETDQNGCLAIKISAAIGAAPGAIVINHPLSGQVLTLNVLVNARRNILLQNQMVEVPLNHTRSIRARLQNDDDCRPVANELLVARVESTALHSIDIAVSDPTNSEGYTTITLQGKSKTSHPITVFIETKNAMPCKLSVSVT